MNEPAEIMPPEQLKLIRQFVRVNTLLATPAEFESAAGFKIKKTEIPFVFEVAEMVKIGKTPEYLSGMVHPQSLSSALVPLVLDPKEKDVIWDATASPGSKTTEMAMLMKNTGCIVATDRELRLRAIRANIERLGCANVVMKEHDAKRPIETDYFSKALIDPPCTALGSHEFAWKRFNQDVAESLSRVQKAMIMSGFDSLRSGGTLVYSTCTITPKENEGVVKFLLEKRENARLDNVNTSLPHDSGLSEYGKEFLKTARIYPRHFGSEAFFVAKIQKD